MWLDFAPLVITSIEGALPPEPTLGVPDVCLYAQWDIPRATPDDCGCSAHITPSLEEQWVALVPPCNWLLNVFCLRKRTCRRRFSVSFRWPYATVVVTVLDCRVHQLRRSDSGRRQEGYFGERVIHFNDACLTNSTYRAFESRHVALLQRAAVAKPPSVGRSSTRPRQNVRVRPSLIRGTLTRPRLYPDSAFNVGTVNDFLSHILAECVERAKDCSIRYRIYPDQSYKGSFS